MFIWQFWDIKLVLCEWGSHFGLVHHYIHKHCGHPNKYTHTHNIELELVISVRIQHTQYVCDNKSHVTSSAGQHLFKLLGAIACAAIGAIICTIIDAAFHQSLSKEYLKRQLWCSLGSATVGVVGEAIGRNIGPPNYGPVAGNIAGQVLFKSIFH